MARTAKVPIRRQYSDTDRWRAYNHWVSTGRFTKTTARECYLSVSTLRAWVKSWDVDPETQVVRNPPTQPSAEEIELTSQDEGNLVAEYRSLRQMALTRLREVIPKTTSADQLGRIVKELSHSIDRSEGLHDAPSTVNVNIRLAEARAAGENLMGAIQKSLTDAAQRQSDIIDVESQEIASTSEEVST